MKLSEAMALFLAAKKSRNRANRTLDWYFQQINAFESWLLEHGPADDWCKPEVIEQFLCYERDRGLSASTVEGRRRGLATIFRFFEERNLLGGLASPLQDLEPLTVDTRPPRRADPDDVRRLILSIGLNDWLDYRDRLIVQLFRSTGMRVEEAVELRIGDIIASKCICQRFREAQYS